MTSLRSILAILAFAAMGVVLGAGLGYGAGIAYVELTDMSPIEGQQGAAVFLEFMPAGAILGMILLPAIFGFWRRHSGTRKSPWHSRE
ncbi:hypothetical protein [Burkholderia gladioli]|uniref:hypothetical protein n=1 Tax=Burkholderia gladioli TaxID=28095 RepID=UPI00163E4A87|nr:hypothetical protein [Burkholderia gladioli]MBU9168555.1 hypothetical protein [Burkholderia gladioli]MBU9379368.1 hypothetical protein [Burkholderia gladioli]